MVRKDKVSKSSKKKTESSGSVKKRLRQAKRDKKHPEIGYGGFG